MTLELAEVGYSNKSRKYPTSAPTVAGRAELAGHGLAGNARLASRERASQKAKHLPSKRGKRGVNRSTAVQTRGKPRTIVS